MTNSEGDKYRAVCLNIQTPQCTAKTPHPRNYGGVRVTWVSRTMVGLAWFGLGVRIGLGRLPTDVAIVVWRFAVFRKTLFDCCHAGSSIAGQKGPGEWDRPKSTTRVTWYLLTNSLRKFWLSRYPNITVVSCLNCGKTRQFDRPMSNEMAALSREDTTPQSLVDAHGSSAVQ